MLVADHVEQLIELVRFARVEAGGGLIETQQHRIGAHRARDFEAALRAVGQFAGGIVGAFHEADLVEPILGALDRLALCGAITRRPEHAKNGQTAGDHQLVVVRDHQVLEHRHALKQPDVLERARHPRMPSDLVAGHALEQVDCAGVGLGMAAAAARHRVDIIGVDDATARQRKAAFGRLIEAGHAVEHRRLAGAVGADERGDVAASRFEAEIVDGDEAAKAHRQMFDDQQGIGLPAHQPCPSLTRSPDTVLRSLRKIEGARVDMNPRGLTTIMITIAKPNSRPRYCAGSKSGMPK